MISLPLILASLCLSPGAPAAPEGEISRRLREAPDHAVVEIGPGVYREHLRITRPVTLVGVGDPVIDGGGAGDIVEITAPGVTLRGFTIRNTGIDLDGESAAVRVLAPAAVIERNTIEDALFGIDLREAPNSILRDNRVGGKALDIARRGDGVRLWRADGTVMEGNTIHDGRDAILWYSRDVVVRRNAGLNCRYGLHLMYSDDVVIEENHFEGNSVGIYLMYSRGVTLRHNRLLRNRGPSGYGLGFKEVDRYTVEHNLFAGNRVGIYLDGSPFSGRQPALITMNIVACNDIGVAFLPSVRGNLFTANNFVDNIEQVAVLGRGELRGNDFSVDQYGNFWSDYVGYDEDRDGVGDFVHESTTTFENLLDREPKLRFLLFSPAQQAVELVGRAIPAIRPDPKFFDEYPLMQPVSIEIAGAPGERSSPLPALALLGAGSLLAAGAAAPYSRRRRGAP